MVDVLLVYVAVDLLFVDVVVDRLLVDVYVVLPVPLRYDVLPVLLLEDCGLDCAVVLVLAVDVLSVPVLAVVVLSALVRFRDVVRLRDARLLLSSSREYPPGKSKPVFSSTVFTTLLTVLPTALATFLAVSATPLTKLPTASARPDRTML